MLLIGLSAKHARMFKELAMATGKADQAARDRENCYALKRRVICELSPVSCQLAGNVEAVGLGLVQQLPMHARQFG